MIAVPIKPKNLPLITQPLQIQDIFHQSHKDQLEKTIELKKDSSLIFHPFNIEMG
jgi:hypothetical protein